MSTSSSLAPVWRRARLSYERAHARARRHQRRYWAGVAVIAVVSGTLVDRLGAPPPGAPPPSPAAATPTGPPSSGGLAERLTPGTRAVALPRTGADLPVVAAQCAAPARTLTLRRMIPLSAAAIAAKSAPTRNAQ